jgi:pyridinium-3,5-biscarboxylic acid mononucleotide sulfurtransferase
MESLERLRAVFRTMPSVLVCYSGGVDSAVVLAVAHEVLGAKALGITAVSASLAPSEKVKAIELAATIGARHELIASHEIEREGYKANGADRCFHCKSELYEISARVQTERDFAFTANGTNLDDLGDYRPGLEAAKAGGVRSPLVEAGLRKSDVREIAKALGLPVWDKPAAACLSSRLPYGTEVTEARLHQIAKLEEALHMIGLKQVRVRWHALSTGTLAQGAAAETVLARIEVSKEELTRAFELREQIVTIAKPLGYAFVTMDLQGYRVGSHNEVLTSSAVKGRSLPVVG